MTKENRSNIQPKSKGTSPPSSSSFSSSFHKSPPLSSSNTTTTTTTTAASSSSKQDQPLPLEEAKSPELYSNLTVQEHELGESVFAKYEKVKQIEEGGTGEVWLVKRKRQQPEQSEQSTTTNNDNESDDVDVYDNDDNDDDDHENDYYAVKVIEKEFLFGIFGKELRNEIETLRSIDHPHVVRIYETFETRHYLYLVMEYCNGDLASQFGLPCRSERTAARIVTQILSAVAHCHKRKIIHRDLKMENVLFRKNGRGHHHHKNDKDIDENDNEDDDDDDDNNIDVALIDFGLSQRYRRPRGDYTMKLNVGTTYTMSPQVIQGRYDEKADVWSIGVLTYMLLSGKRPFDAQTDADIRPKILKGEYSMDGPPWQSISSLAKDFVSQLLKYNAETRVLAEEALQHAWLQQYNNNHNHNASSSQQQPQQGHDGNNDHVNDSHRSLDMTLHESTESSNESNKNNTDTTTNNVVTDEIKHALLHVQEEPKLKRLAKMIIAHHAPAHRLDSLRRAFEALDQSQDGTITFAEFQAAILQNHNNDPDHNDDDDDHDDDARRSLSTQELREIFDELDQSHVGAIHYTDFLSATLEASHDAATILHDDQALTRAFDALDVDHTGVLTQQSLGSVLPESMVATATMTGASKPRCGKNSSSDEIPPVEAAAAEILQQVNPNGDSNGTVSLEEFSQLFRAEEDEEEGERPSQHQTGERSD